jgi:predicted pyridoxine 5'-phosphate oxidase superfamily flavin-nucleotide-binding protein
VVDNPKESSKNLIAAVNAMNRIHIRRARLLGLDAPQKLDIRGLYRIGGDQQSAERLARERVLEAVPLDEQERMYEVLAAARKRVEAADIETTATRVTNGPDRSSLTIDPPPDTAEHNEE